MRYRVVSSSRTVAEILPKGSKSAGNLQDIRLISRTGTGARDSSVNLMQSEGCGDSGYSVCFYDDKDCGKITEEMLKLHQICVAYIWQLLVRMVYARY